MNKEHIGNLIAKLRKEKNLTQDELGDLLGVSGKSVSKWERGLSIPDTKTLNNLANILGVKLADLLNCKKEILDSNQGKNKIIKNKKVLFLIILVFIIIYSGILITITKKQIESKYSIANFTSFDSDYAVSGSIIYTSKGKIFILNNLDYQGPNRGTTNEVYVKRISITIKNDNNEFYTNSVESSDLDNKLYKLSELLNSFSAEIHKLDESFSITKDNLTLLISYTLETDVTILEKVNLNLIN